MPTKPLTEEDARKLLDAAHSDALPTHQGELADVLGENRKTINSRIKTLGLSEGLAAIFAENKLTRRERLRSQFSGTHETRHTQAEDVHGLVQNAAPDGSVAQEEEPSEGKQHPEAQIVGATANVRPDIHAIVDEADRRYKLTERRAQQKMNQSVRFAHGPVAIFFLGDQHIGNKGTHVRRMLDEQKMIMETPGAYVWQMGDIVDNFIIGRLVAENFKESLPIWDQWELAKFYLHGFKDRLIAANGGNHDFWHHKVSGIDYTRDITPSGVLYDADTIRARVHVGPHVFKVWTRHKWKGKSMYNPTHGQERGAREDDPDQDIYVGAHNHTGAVCREFIRKAHRKLAIQIGTYKMVDDYALSEGFPRHDSSTACGVVLHDDGSFFACADIQAVLNYMRAVYR